MISPGVMNDLDAALDKIGASVKELNGACQEAFWEAGANIIRASMKKVPVDTGNLRGSAYVRSASKTEIPEGGYTGGGQMPTDSLPAIGVEVGYYADYALPVHENVEQKLKGQTRSGGSGKGSYWDSGEPKFLESVVINNQDRIVSIIRRRTEMEIDRMNNK